MLDLQAMPTNRLYYDDSFLTEFDAQVLRCEQAPDNASPAWRVTLDSTAFYPNSGGQPADKGKLGNAAVLDVEDQGDEIAHILDRAVPIGPIHGVIEWPRRFDHMQQHSAQHLLSAILQEGYRLPTVSFHLGSEVSTIDVRGEEPPAGALEEAEWIVNETIFENRPVSVRYGTAEELAEVGVRKQVDRTGTLRAIEIEGIEVQPCGGTHVRGTGQIGMLLLRRVTKIRQDWRIEFLAGGRAARAARKDYQLLRGAADSLKCAIEDMLPSVDRALADRDARFKSLNAATERLAAAEAKQALEETPIGPDGLRIIARVIEGVEPIYLAKFATRLAHEERTIAILTRKECGHLAFAQHASSGKAMNDLLEKVVKKIGGKGGGTRDFARGALADPSHAAHAIEYAVALLTEVQALS
jgi:alanyl-tRNA synthetase